ncbi:GAF domain-containing protein, partial [Phyllobacterium sp. P5_D12]
MSNSSGAQITLVDEKRSRVLSHAGRIGIANIWAIEASSLAAPDKSCLIILNAAEDVRYSEIDAVTQRPNLRFLAVAPICVSDECIGALSVLSDEPRTEFALTQQEQLMHLARLAGSFISLKRESRTGTDAVAKLHQDEDRNSMALEV